MPCLREAERAVREAIVGIANAPDCRFEARIRASYARPRRLMGVLGLRVELRPPPRPKDPEEEYEPVYL
jgi:hypothetical protein